MFFILSRMRLQANASAGRNSGLGAARGAAGSFSLQAITEVYLPADGVR